MAVLDEDFGTGLTLVEGNGEVRSSPVLVPERAPRDWRSQCERERARADAAEARAEELRWAEVASRSDAGSWKSRFKACRRRLSEAVEETKEARRAARDVQAEVACLETLLSEAGVESNEGSTIEALRKEITRLNNEAVRRDKQVLQLNKRLDQEKQRTESIREVAGRLSRENLRLHREVRILDDWSYPVSVDSLGLSSPALRWATAGGRKVFSRSDR